MPLRGVVADTHASPVGVTLTPAAPGSVSRRTSRPVVRLSTATRPPVWTTTARVAVTARSSGVPDSLRRPTHCAVAVSTKSIAPLRAAKTRIPSGETAIASGTPGTSTLPAPMRAARSIIVTVRPDATYARVPSGAAATARVRPGVAAMPETVFVRVSSSATWDEPVATITTRASATAGARHSRAREIRSARTDAVTRPIARSRGLQVGERIRRRRGLALVVARARD